MAAFTGTSSKSNVLLPPGGVKLVDMGIARLLSPEALTATLTLRGTARYISPEQARGDAVDSRADLYSLGCVQFEMLVGRPPFEGDLSALSYAHAHTPAPRVRSMDPSVPAPLDELVAALLEKDPADRPQSGADVRTSLDPAMRQTGATRTVPIERVPREPTRRLPVLERVRRARSVSPAILIAPRAFSASSCSSRRSPARVRTAGQRSLAVAASGRLAHDGAALAAEGRRIVGAGGSRRARSRAASARKSVTRSMRSSASSTRTGTYRSPLRRWMTSGRKCSKRSRRAKSPPQLGALIDEALLRLREALGAEQ